MARVGGESDSTQWAQLADSVDHLSKLTPEQQEALAEAGASAYAQWFKASTLEKLDRTHETYQIPKTPDAGNIPTIAPPAALTGGQTENDHDLDAVLMGLLFEIKKNLFAYLAASNQASIKSGDERMNTSNRAVGFERMLGQRADEAASKNAKLASQKPKKPWWMPLVKVTVALAAAALTAAIAGSDGGIIASLAVSATFIALDNIPLDKEGNTFFDAKGPWGKMMSSMIPPKIDPVTGKDANAALREGISGFLKTVLAIIMTLGAGGITASANSGALVTDRAVGETTKKLVEAAAKEAAIATAKTGVKVLPEAVSEEMVKAAVQEAFKHATYKAASTAFMTAITSTGAISDMSHASALAACGNDPDRINQAGLMAAQIIATTVICIAAGAGANKLGTGTWKGVVNTAEGTDRMVATEVIGQLKTGIRKAQAIAGMLVTASQVGSQWNDYVQARSQVNAEKKRSKVQEELIGEKAELEALIDMMHFIVSVFKKTIEQTNKAGTAIIEFTEELSQVPVYKTSVRTASEGLRS